MRYALKENLKSILEDARMPGRTAFHDWMTKRPDFAAKFARARELRGVMRVDENDVVARDVLDGKTDPNAGRTFILNNQWAAAREAPRSYGDKLDIFAPGRGGGAGTSARRLADRIASAVAALGLPHRVSAFGLDARERPRVAELLRSNYPAEVGDLGVDATAKLDELLESLW